MTKTVTKEKKTKLFGIDKDCLDELPIKNLPRVLTAFQMSYYNKRCGFVIPTILRSAQKYAGKKGYVLSMPQLLNEPETYPSFGWGSLFTLSEEDIGKDTEGRFFKKGTPVVVTVHGGGILTPERIEKAYRSSTEYQAPINLSQKEEIVPLLRGQLQFGKQIPLYEFGDFKKGIPNLKDNYGIVQKLETASNVTSGYLSKSKLYGQPLFIARMGGVKRARTCLENVVGNGFGFEHELKMADPNKPSGSLLCYREPIYWFSSMTIGTVDLYSEYNGQQFVAER